MLKLTHPTVDIAIVCSDFEESLHFYHQCLGFEIVMDIEIPAEVAIGAKLAPRGFRQVRLQVGNTLIKLMDIKLSPEPMFNEFNPGVRWLTIFVEDVYETVRERTKWYNIPCGTRCGAGCCGSCLCQRSGWRFDRVCASMIAGVCKG